MQGGALRRRRHVPAIPQARGAHPSIFTESNVVSFVSFGSLVFGRNGNNAVTILWTDSRDDVSTKHTKRQKIPRLEIFGGLASRIIAGGLKRAVFGGPVPDKWSEFHLAADRVRRFELSLKHQCSHVAAHVPERKFHRAGKRH